jgi:transposase
MACQWRETNVATYAALIEELSSHGYMALGIDHPYEAVAGQVEGNVNRLKMIKRIMFGRAGFALLRSRVLHPTG